MSLKTTTRQREQVIQRNYTVYWVGTWPLEELNDLLAPCTAAWKRLKVLLGHREIGGRRLRKRPVCGALPENWLPEILEGGSKSFMGPGRRWQAQSATAAT